MDAASFGLHKLGDLVTRLCDGFLLGPSERFFGGFVALSEDGVNVLARETGKMLPLGGRLEEEDRCRRSQSQSRLGRGCVLEQQGVLVVFVG